MEAAHTQEIIKAVGVYLVTDFTRLLIYAPYPKLNRPCQFYKPFEILHAVAQFHPVAQVFTRLASIVLEIAQFLRQPYRAYLYKPKR